MSQTQNQRANGDQRVIPGSIATPSSWKQVRAIDNDSGVTGEWYECEEADRGIYITESGGGWKVGIYSISGNHTIETEYFDLTNTATSYVGKLAFETHH